MSARITKNELIAINARLSAEIATLRAELSAAKAQCAVLSEIASDAHNSNVRPQTEHEYATREEAIAACKRLVASEYNRRAVFSVVGTKVIARARAH